MIPTLLFLLGVATDILWVRAVQTSVARRPLHASTYNMLLAVIGLSSTWTVIANDSLPGLTAYVLGCGLGTYLTSLKKP